LGACRSTHLARRLGEAEQPLDGVAAHPQSAGDDRLGAALPMEEPMDLGPVCSVFDRREVLSFHPASTG